MSVNNKRVFRCGSEWWNAVVVSSSGFVDDIGVRRMDRDEVVLTCLTKQDALSRRISINSGYLGKLNHDSVCRLISDSEPLDDRHDYSIGELPSDIQGDRIGYTDGEGVRWLLSDSYIDRMCEDGTVRKIPAVEVVCIDDSVIRGKVGMEDSFTFQSFYERFGDIAYEEIVGIVSSSYSEYEDAKPSIEPVKNDRTRMMDKLRFAPIGTALEAQDVRFGVKKTKIGTPTFFAIGRISHKGKTYSVKAGIYHGKVFAATSTTRNEAIELAIIAAIESNPEHVFVYQEYQKCLEIIEKSGGAVKDQLD